MCAKVIRIGNFLRCGVGEECLLTNLIMSTLLKMKTGIPISVSTPIHRIFRAPPNVSTPVRPLLLCRTSRSRGYHR